MSGSRVTGPVLIESDQLRVTVDPSVGGTIKAVEHLELHASVLGTLPWEALPGPTDTIAAPDEPNWLRYYTGGWPLLFPNGGDACTFDGVFHGFHGEASLAPWYAEIGDSDLRLFRRFESVPVEMHRHMALDGDVLTIRETVRLVGDKPIRVMWGQHATFGSDLLDGPFEIQTGARKVTADPLYDPEENPLRPGATGNWPMIAGWTGPFDLSEPESGITAVACIHDFVSAWASIRRLDDAVGAALSWDPKVYPCAWLWYELHGRTEPPWNSQSWVIGIEPNTTWPPNGLAHAAEAGGHLLTLQPGEDVSSWIRLHVFKPDGTAIVGVDPRGRAVAGPFD